MDISRGAEIKHCPQTAPLRTWSQNPWFEFKLSHFLGTPTRSSVMCLSHYFLSLWTQKDYFFQTPSCSGWGHGTKFLPMGMWAEVKCHFQSRAVLNSQVGVLHTLSVWSSWLDIRTLRRVTRWEHPGSLSHLSSRTIKKSHLSHTRPWHAWEVSFHFVRSLRPGILLPQHTLPYTD